MPTRLPNSFRCSASTDWCRRFLPPALLTLAAPLAAQDGVARTLIDRELNEQHVSLVRIEADRVLFRDDLGMLRSHPTERLIAITTTETPQPDRRGMRSEDPLDRPPRAILELTDGQRLTGAMVPLAPEAPPDEIIRWSHPLAGAMEFRLDDIQRIILSPDDVPAGAAGGTGDVVILLNGDRLEGFIEGLGAAVHLEIAGQVRELPLDRIASIVLANPPSALSGHILYLRDGTILASDQLASASDGHIAVVPRATGVHPRSQPQPRPQQPASEAAALHIPLVQVAAITLDAASLSPLASLPIARQEPADGRRWGPPLRTLGQGIPLLGAPDLEFPGPMTVEWVLPEGAAAFATHAELPRTMWNWGDCELIVSLVAGSGTREATAEVFRARINADAPLARIHIDLPAAAREVSGRGPTRLRIQIDPGLHGPVQDQILLRRPMLRIDRPPG